MVYIRNMFLKIDFVIIMTIFCGLHFQRLFHYVHASYTNQVDLIDRKYNEINSVQIMVIYLKMNH
jgi:hypothetical protein